MSSSAYYGNRAVAEEPAWAVSGKKETAWSFVFYNLELSLIGPGSSIHISIFFFDGADTQKAQQ